MGSPSAQRNTMCASPFSPSQSRDPLRDTFRTFLCGLVFAGAFLRERGPADVFLFGRGFVAAFLGGRALLDVFFAGRDFSAAFLSGRVFDDAFLRCLTSSTVGVTPANASAFATNTSTSIFLSCSEDKSSNPKTAGSEATRNVGRTSDRTMILSTAVARPFVSFQILVVLMSCPM